jgi:hypothetical protein
VLKKLAPNYSDFQFVNIPRLNEIFAIECELALQKISQVSLIESLRHADMKVINKISYNTSIFILVIMYMMLM